MLSANLISISNFGGVSSANEYRVYHKRFMVCVTKTVEGQMTLKTRVNIFWFLKHFCSIEGIYRYS